jgi:hypothetical protein
MTTTKPIADSTLRALQTRRQIIKNYGDLFPKERFVLPPKKSILNHLDVDALLKQHHL